MHVFHSPFFEEFKRPELPADEQIKAPPAKKRKSNLGDIIREHSKQGKSYLGHTELTRLWNLCPDNLSACSGEDRNFLPAIEPYLNANKDNGPDASFAWRALRLLARQSPHFFSLAPTPSRISDYLDTVRLKMQEAKTKQKPETEPRVEPENDLVVEKEDVLAEEESEILKGDPLDDRNVHKTSVATESQLKELSVIVGNDWKKLGAKLGMFFFYQAVIMWRIFMYVWYVAFLSFNWYRILRGHTPIPCRFQANGAGTMPGNATNLV